MSLNTSFIACDTFGKQFLDVLAAAVPLEPAEKCELNRRTIIAGTIAAVRNSLSGVDTRTASVLPVILGRDTIYIGAFGGSDCSSGCAHCLTERIVRGASQEDLALMETEPSKVPQIGKYIFSPHILPTAASIVFDALSGAVPTDRVMLVKIHLGQVRREHLLPQPECRYCHGSLSAHDVDGAHGASSYSPTRTRSLDEISPFIHERCYGPSVGVVGELLYDLQMPFASSVAYLKIRKRQSEPSLGRSLNFDRSRTIALLEALERLSGFDGHLGIPVINAAYRDLPSVGLDPRSLTLHSDEQYETRDFPFARFHEDRSLPWVAGENLTTKKPVWVPQCMAFYGASLFKDKSAIAFESSNGCSVGFTKEEAALHGVLELVERDSFLVTWYRKLQIPRITEVMRQDREFSLVCERVQLFTGATIEFYDSTREHGIPSVIAVASSDRDGEPARALAAGSGLSLSDASRSAVFELGGHYLRLKHMLSQSDVRRRAYAMLADSRAVTLMEDHGIVNALPEARARFAFLDHAVNRGPLQEAPWDLRQQSPKDTLHAMLERLAGAGFEVVIVDQTPNTLRALGLHCVKVLIPHFVPITFGHRFARLESKRLRSDDGRIPSLDDVLVHPFP